MKAKDGEKNAEVAYAGTADKLKLKNLVKSEVNLALFTGDILQEKILRKMQRKILTK